MYRNQVRGRLFRIFLIQQAFRLRKLAKLLGQMWFYSAGIAILVLLWHFQPYSLEMIVKSLVPIYSINWFAYTYLVLYLLVPFLNMGIQKDPLLVERAFLFSLRVAIILPVH